MKRARRIVAIVLVLAILPLCIGCGDTKEIDGYIYDTYGLINKEESRNENIQYRLIIGNVVWSCILVETIIAPIYFLGFSIYEPIGKKNIETPKGTI